MIFWTLDFDLKYKKMKANMFNVDFPILFPEVPGWIANAWTRIACTSESVSNTTLHIF